MSRATETDIAELLEQEERQSQRRLAAENAAASATENGAASSLPASSSASRHTQAPQAELNYIPLSDETNPGDTQQTNLQNHNSNNRYSSEREHNDLLRSRRSKDMDHYASSDQDSANGSISGGGNYVSRNRRAPLITDSYRPGRQSQDRSRSPARRERADRPRVRSPGRLERPDGEGRHGPIRGRGGRDRSPPRYLPRDRSPRQRSPRGRGPRENGARSPARSQRTSEQNALERDQCTVFVSQLANRLRQSQLREFFSRAGNVKAAEIVTDRVSNRSKGVGYVEFYEKEATVRAIAMTGQQLLGIPVIVAVTEAEKNRQVRATENGASQSNGAPHHRLYVGNIHFSVTEDDLRELFSVFGELENVLLQKDESGRSKGYGFVQYVNPEDAKEALVGLNNFELAGRPIRVGLGNERVTETSAQSTTNQSDGSAPGASNDLQQGSAFSGLGGRGNHGDRGGRRDADRNAGASALDDADFDGIKYGRVDRHALMQKLARTDQSANASSSKARPQAPAAAAQPQPTRCIHIKHMYDEHATGDAWQKGLLKEVKDECNSRHGKVIHIALALDEEDGSVYVKFETVESAIKAWQNLNGRHFDLRMLSADYVIERVYDLRFNLTSRI